jgi:nucleotide-binding universal stress UspA family protein
MPPGSVKPYAVKTILVPTDFSEGSQAALEHATALAHLAQARIVVLHVIETIAYTMKESLHRVDAGAMAKRMTESPQLMDVYALVQRAVEPALDQIVQDLQKNRVSASRCVLQGTAYDQIAAQAKEIGADLIVMGTHGRRGVNHMFMGSVAERVVRMAPCPVLTVRAPHDHAAPPA